MQSTSWEMLAWMKHKLESRLLGEIINNLRYADNTNVMSDSEEELKCLLMKVKEESAKVGLKLNIQKTKTMASGPITSWQIDGETMETVSDFIFLDSKITADGDCSHEIWVNSGSWWWTGRPSVLQSMRSQRVKHDWVTEMKWTELKIFRIQSKVSVIIKKTKFTS